MSYFLIICMIHGSCVVVPNHYFSLADCQTAAKDVGADSSGALSANGMGLNGFVRCVQQGH